MEFFVSNDEVWCQTENGMERLDENNETLINYMYDKIYNFYPDAYKSLSEWYAKSKYNLQYMKFLCVRRFCKCNFGLLDTTIHDCDIKKNFHFEKVCCPLRGECKYEGIVCLPKFNSTLSDAEKRVMKLFFVGKDVNEIAEELYLSPNTVKNHRKSVYLKLGIHTNVEFVKYAQEHNLFK